MEKSELREISQHFKVNGAYLSCNLIENGHINDTYKLIVGSGESQESYILQKINHHVFADIYAVMSNIFLVTEYLHKVISEAGRNSLFETLTIIKTTEDQLYYQDRNTNTYWRVYRFISDTNITHLQDKNRQLALSGLAFGSFHERLNHFDIQQLHETIPAFHDTKKRFQAFREAVNQDTRIRAESIRDEIHFFLEREAYADKVLRLIDQGIIPVRVTHNDTKLNNVLIHPETQVTACIDLDTVMPGSLLYDFGDSIRSGANHALEDEKDLSKVTFDLSLFKAYTTGYFQSAKTILTPSEVEMLAFSAILITYECGMRFLTDYLNGDTYFKINRVGHNLDRARTQIKLVRDMESQYEAMRKVVFSCYQSI